jgi:hypothetical protein
VGPLFLLSFQNLNAQTRNKNVNCTGTLIGMNKMSSTVGVYYFLTASDCAVKAKNGILSERAWGVGTALGWAYANDTYISLSPDGARMAIVSIELPIYPGLKLNIANVQPLEKVAP